MIVLVLAAAATLSPTEAAMQEYQRCLEGGVGRYAKLNEPAETVVTAAVAGCAEVRTRMRTEAMRGKPAEFVPVLARTLDDFEKDARQKAVRQVLEARLRS